MSDIELNPLYKSLQTFLAANDLETRLQVIQDFPEIMSEAADEVIQTLLTRLEKMDQDEAANVIIARLNILVKIKKALRPIPHDLAELLNEWIHADTVEESMALLEANKQRLLSDEALEGLRGLLLRSFGKDEVQTTFLAQQLSILEKARAESIEAVYAERLKPRVIEQALHAIPSDLHDAMRALVAVQNSDGLHEQVKRYPVLLTRQGIDAVITLLDELRKIGQEQDVLGMQQRLNILEQIIKEDRDPIWEIVEALVLADTPSKLRQTITENPILIEESTLNRLKTMADKVKKGGGEEVAQMLHLRIDEVQRIQRQHKHISASDNFDTISYADNKELQINPNQGSIGIGINKAPIHLTNYTIENYSLPAKKWEPPIRHFLPKTFVGRQRDLEKLHQYLEAGQADRMKRVMLLGMAGIGKTYLALKLAIELEENFLGGAIRINLGPLINSEEDAQVQLRELAGYAFNGLQPQTMNQLHPEQVAAWLQETAPGGFLVIFDDVWYQEPLLFLERALPRDTLRIITTRDANIAQALGGMKVTLSRMELTDGLALLEDRLNCQGDTKYRADLEEIVKLLGGHALALDIAAARIKEPQRIKAILDDLQQGIGRGTLAGLKLPRNETRDTNLEKSLALSYDRMTAEEQSRFRALGVFSPETLITVEAAAAIWGMDDLKAVRIALFELKDLALLDEIEELEETYRQHGLLRAYAFALLNNSDELSGASWAHAYYYAEMADQAEQATPKNYQLLDQHIQNLLAALKWSVNNEPTLFAKLLAGSCQFLRLRGHLALLEEYITRAVIVAAKTDNKVQQGYLLRHLGELKYQQGQLDEARTHFEAALPLFRVRDDRLNEANVLRSLGDLERLQDNVEQARAYYDAALPLFRATKNRRGEANLLLSMGMLEDQLGHFEQARVHYDAALPLYRSISDQLGEANLLQLVGDIEVELDHFEQARVHYDAALLLFRRERFPLGEANTLKKLANLENHLNNFIQAHTHYKAALPLFQAIHHIHGEADTLINLSFLDLRLSHIDQALSYTYAVQPLFANISNQPREAYQLMMLGSLESHLGNLENLRSHHDTASLLFDQARTHLNAALLLFRAQHDQQGEAHLLDSLANLESYLGNLKQARIHYEAALVLCRAESNRSDEANLLKKLGDLEKQRGNISNARSHYSSALLLYQAESNHLGQADLLEDLGELETELGNLEKVYAHFNTALLLYQAHNKLHSEAGLLRKLGFLEHQLGNLEKARTYFNKALSIYQSEHFISGEANVYMNLADLSLTDMQWDQAKAYAEQALPLFVSTGDVDGQASILMHLGRADFELGDYEQGIHEVQEAAKIFRSAHYTDRIMRAEGYLTQMQAWLEQHKAIRVLSLSSDDELLLQVFVNVGSPRSMLQLVKDNPQLLTNKWFTIIETVIASQTNEQNKLAISQRLDVLKQYKKTTKAES